VTHLNPGPAASRTSALLQFYFYLHPLIPDEVRFGSVQFGYLIARKFLFLLKQHDCNPHPANGDFRTVGIFSASSRFSFAIFAETRAHDRLLYRISKNGVKLKIVSSFHFAQAKEECKFSSNGNLICQFLTFILYEKLNSLIMGSSDWTCCCYYIFQ